MAEEISLWLDSYDDIYSDFDSRHYLKRRISEDLIDELQASFKYRPGKVENLVLLLPASQRKRELEKEIAVSMKEQFHSRYTMLDKKAKRIYLRGVIMVIAGILIMAIDSLIAYKGYKTYPVVVLRIIIEPAAWFLIWNGLDSLLYDYRRVRKEASFYEDVEQLKIHFKDL